MVFCVECNDLAGWAILLYARQASYCALLWVTSGSKGIPEFTSFSNSTPGRTQLSTTLLLGFNAEMQFCWIQKFVKNGALVLIYKNLAGSQVNESSDISSMARPNWHLFPVDLYLGGQPVLNKFVAGRRTVQLTNGWNCECICVLSLQIWHKL